MCKYRKICENAETERGKAPIIALAAAAITFTVVELGHAVHKRKMKKLDNKINKAESEAVQSLKETTPEGGEQNEEK